MDVNDTYTVVARHLAVCTKMLSGWIQEKFPQANPDWWKAMVLPALSYQQAQHVERNWVATTEKLDLTALLRIIDKNWYDISSRFNLSQQDRHIIKEMQTLRNRWAHMDAENPSTDDIYRDADTIQRLMESFGAPPENVAAVKEFKREVIGMNATGGGEPARSGTGDFPVGDVTTDSAPKEVDAGEVMAVDVPVYRDGTGDFPVGDKVALASDMHKVGIVTKFANGRYTVFMDGKDQFYYPEQLRKPAPPKGEEFAPIEALHTRLTASMLNQPSLSSLYSLNAARIEFVPYQFRPALKIIRADEPRLLVADGVGVGKTIEAGLILRELQARQDINSVLVVCPKPLVAERKWEQEMRRFDEQFTALDGPALDFCIKETDLEGVWPDKQAKCIIPYSLLQQDKVLFGEEKTKTRGKKLGLLDLDPPPAFDLLIVDEAHHIRNTNTNTHRALRFLCDHAKAVVFLTATPVQLGNEDLFVLLNTLRPDLVIDEAVFKHMAEPNPRINAAVAAVRGGSGGWNESALGALEQAADTEWGRACLRGNPDFESVLDRLSGPEPSREDRVGLIREIEDFHSFAGLINRTRRRDIGDFCVRNPETVEVPLTAEQQALHDSLLNFTAKALAARHGDISVLFMMTTLRRQAASCLYGLAPLVRAMLGRHLEGWGDLVLEADKDEGEFIGDMAREFGAEAGEIAARAESLSDLDPKFDALLDIVRQKRDMPNHRLMVFSSFLHTLGYLRRRLEDCGVRVGLVHGAVGDEERRELRRRFEAPRDGEDALDVLLFSEVGCEGLDYQFCDAMVNYDLPWNPMRIEQRIGRIDRRGQKSGAVAVWNMITPGTIDAEIYHRCLWRIGVFRESVGDCEEILGEVRDGIAGIAGNFRLTPEQRAQKLDQLADNEIRRLQEERALEDGQHEFFGLRPPKSGRDGDVRDADNYWLGPEALERLVLRYLRERTGKEDPLTGDDPGRKLTLSQEARNLLLKDYNRLPRRDSSPFYREWERWLKGGRPACPVTFDAACAADNRDVQFIMPLHPLVRQAAGALGLDGPLRTAFRVSRPDLPGGAHPFAVYAWEMKGLRPETRLIPVCADRAIREELFALLESGVAGPEGEAAVGNPSRDALEEVHSALWREALEEHKMRTKKVCGYRRESLRTSHNNRARVLDRQLAGATDEKIRRMRGAERARVQADFERRIDELNQNEAKADIHAKPLVFGVVLVEG